MGDIEGIVQHSVAVARLVPTSPGTSLTMASTELKPAEESEERERSARVSAASASGTCRWCLRALGPCSPNGRKRIYCSQSCRQQAYQSRKRSRQRGLADGQVVVTSVQLDRIKRRVERLDYALVAVESSGLHLIHPRIAALCEAARGFRGLVVGPRFTHHPVGGDSHFPLLTSPDLSWAGPRSTSSGAPVLF